MGKKKPFIDKKKSSTYQLIHRSQRDITPDVVYNNDNHQQLQQDDETDSRMILWPKEDNIHSTTLPSTDRAVLFGTTTTTTTTTTIVNAANPSTNKHPISSTTTTTATNNTTTSSTTTDIMAWKEQLIQMGVLDTTNHEEYLKPITGSGTFIDGKSGRIINHLNHHNSNSNKNYTTTDNNNDIMILEVDRQMESLPLTTDCMDDDIAALLFYDDQQKQKKKKKRNQNNNNDTAIEDEDDINDDDENYDDIFDQYEELTDDFIFHATGMIPITNDDDDNDEKAGMDKEIGTTTTTAQTMEFDFDAHIQQLIKTAKKNTTIDNKAFIQHDDHDFFHKHWHKPLRNVREDDDDDEYDDDYDNNDDNDNHQHDRNYNRNYNNYYDSNEATSTVVSYGVVPKLNADEERALCDKFEATLAAYDNDDDDDSDYDDTNYGNNNNSNDDENTMDQPTSEYHNNNNSIECNNVIIGRPLEGDAIVEAVLDEYLLEREEDIYIYGTAERHARRTGGSGFAVLVGKQLINAKVLDNQRNNKNSYNKNDDDPIQDEGDEVVDEVYPEQEPPIPIEEYIAIAEETINTPKQPPPAEEIFIDGKSYYEERQRNPWDCESILSTYSNLDNNPITISTISSRRRRRHKGKIGGNNSSTNTSVNGQDDTTNQQHDTFVHEPIRISTKTGLPVGVFDRNRNNNNDDDTTMDNNNDDTVISINKGMKRSKLETPEEKRLRKLVTKRERELARVQKKITREVFNEEYQKYMPSISEDTMAGKSIFRFS